MKITKRAKTTKTTKKTTTTTTRDGDEPDAPAKTNSPQKIGFDITAGPVQDEGLHAKYGAMSLDELKQYMQMNRMPQSEIGQKNKRVTYKKADFVAHCVDGEKW